MFYKFDGKQPAIESEAYVRDIDFEFPEAAGLKSRVTRKTSWIKGLLDLAIEVVSEARAASSSHAREPEELTAFKGRMKDRKIRECTPSGS